MNTDKPFPRASLIQDSLSAFSARCTDPAAIIYARLFALHPGAEDRFRGDARGFVRREMLARAFEVVLDYVDDRRYADGMIRAEAVTHEGYDVPRDLFVSFFACIRDAMCATLAEAWTEDFADAWRDLLGELAAVAREAPRAGEDV